MSAPHIAMTAALILGVIAFTMAAGAAFGPVGMFVFVLGVVVIAAGAVAGGVVALTAALDMPALVLVGVGGALWIMLR